jgi:hypothetical protein
MTIRNTAVSTTSISKAAVIPYPPGDNSPNPFDAKPPGVHSGAPGGDGEQQQRGEHAADDLRGPVEGDLRPREPAADGEAE